jgi:hypothetical protein
MNNLKLIGEKKMMKDQIKSEILTTISSEKNKTVILKTNWIANSVMQKYFKSLPENNDGEMLRYLSILQCRALVRKIVAKNLDGNGTDRRQFIMPGFEHLQNHYAVTREGEAVGVPLSNMTEKEIKAKSKEYRKMGDGNYAHARELDEYLEGINDQAVQK